MRNEGIKCLVSASYCNTRTQVHQPTQAIDK
jgi:hypothetical protein